MHMTGTASQLIMDKKNPQPTKLGRLTPYSGRAKQQNTPTTINEPAFKWGIEHQATKYSTMDEGKLKEIQDEQETYEERLRGIKTPSVEALAGEGLLIQKVMVENPTQLMETLVMLEEKMNGK